ncbi:hypothetical protein DKM44_00430 [Deinococcus irradiatisoli]|uniref:DUF1453 domain-containing protein n=2 Tax=Deinococcus irradiatisoli TaxID=2202254 RepID=A0A2Z3JLF5_9DEIO|nr:hypothetical protein DKM44_00430 [Deinococcus irradiatisoli]
MLLRRFQRLAGAQRLDAGRRRSLVIRSGLLALLLIVVAPHSAVGGAAGLGGLLIGAGLALWSLRHTRFERDAAGQVVRYLPNVWIGGAVFALFVLRLLWRLLPLLNSVSAQSPADVRSLMSGNPLTFALLAVFAAYQIAYAVGVLRLATPATPAFAHPVSEVQK